MPWIVAAMFGGFFVGGFVCYIIGAAKGYACAVHHLTILGKAVLENAATSQVKQTPQPVQVSGNSTRPN